MMSSNELFLGPRGFDQAIRTLCPWQKWAALYGTTGLLLWLVLTPGLALLVLNATFTVFFVISTVYRLMLIDISLRRGGAIRVTADELVPPGGEWPRYVVQVPLYRERGAIPHLLKALGELDYPHDRYLVQLLVEEDDTETREALQEHEIAPPFTIVTIPVSHPRTKPKACNVGLAEAEGDYLVIFDAEDRPDPDQLKKAVIAYRKSPRNVACIQAKLNFYNPNHNLLTRCFAAEYATWFDLCLPGLDALNAPIPLGGTSNHFRLSVLRSLKGWDEYNVTEDCDLGIRLFVDGWRTRILDSTTWEEACSHLPSWYRQRSRWVKGYLQTYLVHTRDLFGRIRQLGWRNSLHFHLLIGGSVLNQLLAPFYWLMVLIWLLFRPPELGAFFPAPVFFLGALCLFVGNFILVYACAVACAARRLGDLVKYTPLMILYWIVMSFAAWKGVLQLLWKPHFWEKTAHHTG